MEQKRLINLSFEEAVYEKNKYPNDIIKEENKDYVIIIAPNKQDDFIEFYEYFIYNHSYYTDDLCKKYSTDDRYQVRAQLISSLK